MSPNKQKIKGSNWERDLVDLLSKNIKNSKVRRIPASGAMGTALGEPMLQGDVIAEFPGFSKKFRIEAKVGYGGNTQMVIKKEWLDKIKEEAENAYSIPSVACKFLGARKTEGVQYFFILDFSTFSDIINYVNNLKEELDLAYKEMH